MAPGGYANAQPEAKCYLGRITVCHRWGDWNRNWEFSRSKPLNQRWLEICTLLIIHEDTGGRLGWSFKAFYLKIKGGVLQKVDYLGIPQKTPGYYASKTDCILSLVEQTGKNSITHHVTFQSCIPSYTTDFSNFYLPITVLKTNLNW